MHVNLLSLIIFIFITCEHVQVTGLSINKVKRKNNVTTTKGATTTTQENSPLSQPLPPSPHGHLGSSVGDTHVLHASSRVLPSLNTNPTSNTNTISTMHHAQYASHHHGYPSSSAGNIHHHDGCRVHVHSQPPPHSHHHHVDMHHAKQYEAEYSNGSSGRVKYYHSNDMQSQPPPPSPHYTYVVHDGSSMHAHYSSSYSPHHNAPPPPPHYQSHSRSPPVSPTHVNSSSSSSYRKSHHYHPYASNENSQYLNGPNSTSSGGSNNVGAASRGGMVQPSLHDPFVRSSPMQHPHATTSPKSPRNGTGTNTSVPSIMEMMGTAPPSYAIGSNPSNNAMQTVNNTSNNVNRNYSNSPLHAFNNGQNKHENAARVENGAPPLSSHRYHPYSNSSNGSNVHRTSSSGREDVIHSPRIYTQEHLQNSPNPSPIRVASIVATGPALPGNVHVASGIPQAYSPPMVTSTSREDAKTSLPNMNVPPPIVKKEENEIIPKFEVKMETETLENRNLDYENNTALVATFEQVKEEDKSILKELFIEPTVNVFLTFVTTTGTQSPTTRLSIPKSIGLNQLKDIIQKRLQKNREEESNVLQLGDEMLIGNIMLKKDENNFVEIDDQFCSIYRFEHHDSLKVSLINDSVL